MKKINKKIPGLLPPPPKNELDGKITHLSSKTIPDLTELRDRQLKLLNNKPFVSKLADKGAKIQACYDRIIREIKAKQGEEQACRMFHNLKLGEVDKDSVQEVEWLGKIEHKKEYLDSDDDSEPENLLQFLSESRPQEKQVRVLKPERPLITPEDLLKIGETPHVKYIVDKTETNPIQKLTGQFKPYKTTISDVHNPEKEFQRKKNKHWEVTAATPPSIIHGPAQLLSIEESLTLQKDYNVHLREIETQHAAEKLLARTGIKMASLPVDTTQFGKYREADSDDSDASDPEGSDKEVHDEEPEKGGVVFTVMK